MNKNYHEINNQGVELLKEGINSADKFKIENSIQFFKKAIAAAEIEGVLKFETAQCNLEKALEELKKMNNYG
jgi:hypothetical protein